MDIKEYIKKIKKVDETKFLYLYNMGYSDRKIALSLGVKSSATPYNYRKKYGLIANNPRSNGPNLSEEELKNKFIEDRKRHQKYMKENKKWSSWKKIYGRERCKIPRVREMVNNSHKRWKEQNPERFIELTLKRESKPEVIEKRRKDSLNYYNKMKNNPIFKEKEKKRKYEYNRRPEVRERLKARVRERYRLKTKGYKKVKNAIKKIKEYSP